MTTRVLQVSDLHLFTDPASEMRGVPTQSSFLEVRDYINQNESDFDWLILTGDLSHDHFESTYRWLRSQIEDWIPRLRMIPGNHEDRTAMRAVFPECIPAAVTNDPAEPLFFQLELDDWVLLGLDSHVPDQVPGRLQNSQLDWLELTLSETPTKSAAIFLHHPPVTVESRWMDELQLQNPERLLAAVERFPQVQAVFCGHVHHEFNGSIGTAGFHTVPATSVQFKPAQASFATDAIPPGYRVIDFQSGAYSTVVKRLPELKHPPELVG